MLGLEEEIDVYICSRKHDLELPSLEIRRFVEVIEMRHRSAVNLTLRLQ